MVFSTIRLLAFSLFFLCSTHSQAHELRPAVADIEATSQSINVSMRVNVEALITEIGPEHSDSDDSPQAAVYNRLRQMPAPELEIELQNYLPSLLDQISLTSGTGEELPLTLASVSIPSVDDVRLPRDSTLLLQAAIRPPTVESVSWSWATQYGPIILRSGTPNDTPQSADTDADTSFDDLAVENSEVLFTQYLQAGGTSKLIALESMADASTGSGFIDYLVIGFEHIIPKGLDHILFVIGLFLLAPRLKHIVWQVSMFTIAHTVTLGLGITQIIELPAHVVEPLIALSITVICVENLFGSRFRPSRLIIVFAFGLLHGLGFAGVLSDIGMPDGQFVSSLVAFNIGVELGQLTVVLACFALVGWWFGNKPWYRHIVTIPGSLAIGGVGLFWFLQRSGLL